MTFTNVRASSPVPASSVIETAISAPTSARRSRRRTGPSDAKRAVSCSARPGGVERRHHRRDAGDDRRHRRSANANAAAVPSMAIASVRGSDGMSASAGDSSQMAPRTWRRRPRR